MVESGKGFGIYCAACCPVHAAQVSIEWQGEPVTVEGKQGALF